MEVYMKLKPTMAYIIIFLSILFTSSSSFAFSQESIAMHGFVSQGYLKSSANNYFSETKDGTFEFNEIGVNFSSIISDNLRFGLQLFSRDFGILGNNELTVDWAFLDYNVYDWLGIRAGKIKRPFGLYNRKRDADMLRTAIILPQSVYNESMRRFVVAIHGVSLYGTKTIGPIGYFDYELFAGTFQIPIDSAYFDVMLNQANYVLPAFGDALSNMNLSDLIIKHAEGVSLTWNTPLEGLKLNTTFLYALGDVQGSTSIPELGVIPFSMDLAFKKFNTQSIEYEVGNLTFALENNQLEIEVDFGAGIPKSTIESQGWYGSVSWDILSYLGIAATYSEFYPNAKDKDGSDSEQAGLPDYYGWEKDVILSIRFNFTEYWCAKLESHSISGLGMSGIKNNPPETAEENWQLFAIKTSLNF